ncbi:hypothetical protein [Pedobacter psychroterrae]|uniref:Uncharacterized protein n=1 Tax=Pedobacter psychroterrae TaxID=2530453 RepID=A0A4V2ML35_9SPHI|nr:hypothetical protein [Pedobacter psychroterrae]TCD00537.1 hypothetical protein EZ437_15070 [Pedobacter psychroterrae]
MPLKRTHKNLLNEIDDLSGIEAMTVNERLLHYDLLYDFDTAMLNNKVRARQILQYLKVDEDSINAMVKD